MIIDIRVTNWIVQAVMSSTMIQRIQSSEGIRGQTRRQNCQEKHFERCWQSRLVHRHHQEDRAEVYLCVELTD